jgi:hypothetical protein
MHVLIAANDEELSESELKSFNASVMESVHPSIKTKSPEHVKIM